MYTGQYNPADFDDQSNSSYQYGNPSPDTNPYGFIDHVVKDGETLRDLAKKYGTSKEKIIEANSGENGQWGKYDRSKGWLYTGETIKIPIATKQEYEIEQIKRWISEQPTTSTLPENQTKPKAHGKALQQAEIDWSKTLTLDYSQMRHHKAPPVFPHIDVDFTKWRKAGTSSECSPEDLKNVKVYVFYISDFINQSWKLANDAIEKYGSDKVVMGYMENARTFMNLWKQMDGSPEIIIINTHGKNQSITTGHGEGNQQFTATGDYKTNIKGTDCQNIQDLPQPKADLSGTRLELNSCHSNDTEPKAHLEGDHHQGDLKGTKQTAAEAFLRRFNFREVRATKEAVNYVDWYNTGWWYGIDDNWEQGDPYPDNDMWEYLSLDKHGKVITRSEKID